MLNAQLEEQLQLPNLRLDFGEVTCHSKSCSTTWYQNQCRKFAFETIYCNLTLATVILKKHGIANNLTHSHARFFILQCIRFEY